MSEQAVGRADQVTPEVIDRLVDDELSWEEWRELLRLGEKDPDRFDKYVAALQQRAGFDDQILMRISDHLYVVAVENGRSVKCDCGQEFGDYRVNWKLSASIYVRDDPESIAEVYRHPDFAPEPGWSEVREYYCPGCQAQLSVEVVPPGYPPIFEFLPDLDSFYGDWLGRPLADQDPSWYEDHTAQVTATWAAGE